MPTAGRAQDLRTKLRLERTVADFPVHPVSGRRGVPHWLVMWKGEETWGRVEARPMDHAEQAKQEPGHLTGDALGTPDTGMIPVRLSTGRQSSLARTD